MDPAYNIMNYLSPITVSLILAHTLVIRSSDRMLGIVSDFVGSSKPIPVTTADGDTRMYREDEIELVRLSALGKRYPMTIKVTDNATGAIKMLDAFILDDSIQSIMDGDTNRRFFDCILKSGMASHLTNGDDHRLLLLTMRNADHQMYEKCGLPDIDDEEAKAISDYL